MAGIASQSVAHHQDVVMSITQDLLDLMPDELRVWKHTGSSDSGDETYEAGVNQEQPPDTWTGGSTYRCRISGVTAVIDNTTAHRLKANVATTDVLKNEDLYVLPSRFDPRVYYGGVQVKPVTDEDGPSHNVVFF